MLETIRSPFRTSVVLKVLKKNGSFTPNLSLVVHPSLAFFLLCDVSLQKNTAVSSMALLRSTGNRGGSLLHVKKLGATALW
jgi:hypothetical protein